MARLLRQNGDGDPEVFDLNLGVNHFGRDPECDFAINHPTISSLHCDVVVTADGILVQDHDSTNGTFVNDEPIKRAVLQTGQKLRLGDVELLVDSTEVRIAIPVIEREIPAPPVVLPSGAMLCPRHPEAKVRHRCTHCHSVLCDTCVTRLRRKGGKTLKLCKLCSHPVEFLPGEGPQKKSFFSKLASTIKMPFLRGKKDDV